MSTNEWDLIDAARDTSRKLGSLIAAIDEEQGQDLLEALAEELRAADTKLRRALDARAQEEA